MQTLHTHLYQVPSLSEQSLHLPPSGTAQHGLRDDDLTHGELTFLPPGMETKTPIRVGIQGGTLHTHTVIHTLQH